MNRKWYEWILTIVYFAMVLLCVFLNFAPGHRESLATIIVNVVMFAIVAVIIITVNRGSFAPMNAIIGDLEHATEKIKKDAMNTRSYLWEPYKSGNIELFKTKEMQEIYRDFLFELNREYDPEYIYYKPNLDDYVNEDLVDSVMHRNELNQVAGMLTGLGILGTFIGLSLGLQNFNTGTTAEMTESIEPLMNGIKVAFHTSIYGMVFSLTFNTIYKRKLYEAQEAVNKFVNAFKKYVLPDTANDGMNEMVKIQEGQLEAINNLTENITNELADILTPQLEEIRDIIVDFENVATENQTKAISDVVNVFITEMNRSLSGSFVKISQSVDDMQRVQNDSLLMMQRVIEATGRSTGTIEDVNRETERLVITLNNYSEGIQKVLDELQKTIMAMGEADKGSRDILMREQSLLADQKSMIAAFGTSIEELVDLTGKNRDETATALSEVNNSLYYIRKSVEGKKDSGKIGRR